MTDSDFPLGVSEPTEGLSLPLVISLGVINTVVVLGNIFVLYILISQKSLHTSTNFIVLSLTLADFLLGIVILPFSMMQEYYNEWAYNELWCKIWLVLDVLFSTASIYNLLAISFDRYMAVRQPIRYRLISSNRMTKIVITTVWVVSACLALPPLVYDHFGSVDTALLHPEHQGSLRPNHSAASPKICTPMTSNDVYIIFSALVSFILPAILMIYLNICIYQTVQDSSRAKLLPLPLTSQSKNTMLSSANPPWLRAHRGGGAAGVGTVGAPGVCSLGKSQRISSKSASVRGRGVMNPGCSMQNISSSFRQKRPDHQQELDVRDVLLKGTPATTPRKKSFSSSSLATLPMKETSVPEPEDAEPETEGWVAKIEPKNTAKVVVMTEKLPKSGKENNGFYPDLPGNSSSIIEKSAEPTVWYPAIIASMLAGRKSRKCSERLLLYPVANFSRSSIRTEYRVARTILVVVGCFTVCWFPFTVIYVLQAFQSCPIDTCVPGWLYTVAFWLGYANSAVNPLLYAAFSRDFRSAFRKVLVGSTSGFRSRFSTSH